MNNIKKQTRSWSCRFPIYVYPPV